jgi:16S rRNA A1518/A1519 N6-dimethyltransferase RsmA/KsgA/DIM1 with predicted DNA glycosylase/AP lyase activity
MKKIMIVSKKMVHPKIKIKMVDLIMKEDPPISKETESNIKDKKEKHSFYKSMTIKKKKKISTALKKLFKKTNLMKIYLKKAKTKIKIKTNKKTLKIQLKIMNPPQQTLKEMSINNYPRSNL